jgi:hypothetical protein
MYLCVLAKIEDLIGVRHPLKIFKQSHGALLQLPLHLFHEHKQPALADKNAACHATQCSENRCT